MIYKNYIFSLLIGTIVSISFSKATIGIPKAFEPSHRECVVNRNNLRDISDTEISGRDSNYGTTSVTIDENKHKIPYVSIYKVHKKSYQSEKTPRLFIIVSPFSFGSKFGHQAGLFHLRV